MEYEPADYIQLFRLNIKPDRIDINLSRRCLAAMLAGQAIDETMQDLEEKQDWCGAFAASRCVYRKPKSERSGDEAHRGSLVT